MMMKEPSTTKRQKQSREVVMRTITDLIEHNQPASRQRIQEITGLSYDTVDMALKRLREDGEIRSVANGYYEPIDQTIDRNVSTTSLPHGRMKLEIGDDIVTNLTPREALALAKQIAGVLFVFGSMSWNVKTDEPKKG